MTNVGDPSIDYALPVTDNVTVEGLDVTRFPQGSMVATHNLRLPSNAPYLDEPQLAGGPTPGFDAVSSQTGLTTPNGQFHTDVLASFETDPYQEVPTEEVPTEEVPTEETSTTNTEPVDGPVEVSNSLFTTDVAGQTV